MRIKRHTALQQKCVISKQTQLLLSGHHLKNINRELHFTGELQLDGLTDFGENEEAAALPSYTPHIRSSHFLRILSHYFGSSLI